MSEAEARDRTADTEAHGYWIKNNNRWQIVWQINGEFITDRALRNFIYHNNPNAGPHDRYVGQCILKWHTDQWARRNDRAASTTKEG